MGIECIIVIDFHLHVPDLLSDGYFVLDRYVGAFHVAQQVLKRPPLGVDADGQILVQHGIALCHHIARAEREAVDVDSGTGLVQLHGTDGRVAGVHVLQELAVAIKWQFKREREHLRVVEDGVLVIDGYGLVWLQDHIFSVNLQCDM